MEEEEKEEEEGEEGRRGKEDEAFSSSGDDYRPFIISTIWSVNDFLSKMTNEVVSRLCPHFQIPDDIPLRMAGKREKCYFGRIADISFYEAIFLVGLRLPLIKLHCRLVDHLCVSISQIYLNSWRIFLRAKVL